ncbi:uncharacterized protein VTP21DRAFT_4898 [Calcarisporiella thermophila]|uniref:uncharacterized protein n=1 Tax=Calcarisporiella thermophila TaxID=911321 RepID=UPI003743C2F7
MTLHSHSDPIPKVSMGLQHVQHCALSQSQVRSLTSFNPPSSQSPLLHLLCASCRARLSRGPSHPQRIDELCKSCKTQWFSNATAASSPLGISLYSYTSPPIHTTCLPITTISFEQNTDRGGVVLRDVFLSEGGRENREADAFEWLLAPPPSSTYMQSAMPECNWTGDSTLNLSPPLSPAEGALFDTDGLFNFGPLDEGIGLGITLNPEEKRTRPRKIDFEEYVHEDRNAMLTPVSPPISIIPPKGLGGEMDEYAETFGNELLEGQRKKRKIEQDALGFEETVRMMGEEDADETEDIKKRDGDEDENREEGEDEEDEEDEEEEEEEEDEEDDDDDDEEDVEIDKDRRYEEGENEEDKENEEINQFQDFGEPCPPRPTRHPTLFQQLTKAQRDWCRYCGTTEGVNWRPGPWGKRTLCNKHGCDYKGYGFACKLPRLDLTEFVKETVADRDRPVLQLYCVECQRKESWKGNVLVRCEGCPKAFHQRCYSGGIESSIVEGKDVWVCDAACYENVKKKRIGS